MRMLNTTTGEVVRGRCRATNLCRYCQRLYVVETVEMLTLDALEDAPTLWAVLTAREHLTRPETYAHLKQLRLALRRRWPDTEWFVQVEFQRRGALHLNLLIKGVPVDQERELAAAINSLWCSRVDAEPVGQWVGVVQDARGVTAYISKMLAHGLKAEQAPPIGWRGHRTSQTRGYLVRPASAMRDEARASLRLKRALHRAIKAGHDAGAAERLAADELAIAAASDWRLIDVTTSLTNSTRGSDRARRARTLAEIPAAVQPGPHPGGGDGAHQAPAGPSGGVDPAGAPACPPEAPAGGSAAPGRSGRQRSAHAPPGRPSVPAGGT
jgi:hypothetical protein